MSKAAPAATIQKVRLLVKAAAATAAPPVGPALASRGLKTIDFVKEFNARTAHIQVGTPTPVQVTIDTANRSFTFTIKSPPTSWLLLKAVGVEKGTGTPPAGKSLVTVLANTPNPALPADAKIPTIGFKEIGTVSLKHIYEIARIKKGDDHLKNIPLEQIAKSVLGTSRNLGIRVVP